MFEMTEESLAAMPPVSAGSARPRLRALLQELLTQQTLIGVALGPFIGLMIWWLPLDLDPAAHKVLAIVAFMLVYWILEPIDYGITALLGCYLFWALHVTKFSIAFSGFANTTPWFILGVLLMGEAASRTGLAKRVGYVVIQRVGTSYSRLLLGMLTLTWLLSFLIPSPHALLATLAPVALGIVAVFGSGARSNLATGLFVILTYTATILSKMIMGGGVTVLTSGIIEAHTGVQVLWSQWLIAYLPAVLPTIVAAWLSVRWLYPVEHDELPRGESPLQARLPVMGPWSRDEQKTLGWLLVAIILWATDFIHHTTPAVIAIGIGLIMVLPKVGVLDIKAFKQVNFLLVIFVGGALSMGTVLMETKVLNLIMDSLLTWMVPLLSDALHASIILYWANFLYHFLLGNELTLVSTSLPPLLKLGEMQGYNPVALGMIWAFAGGGKLFAYQNSVLVVGLSYGYFTGRDLLKIGAVLTLVEGLILMGLVPLYWPLIGLPWRATPAAQVATASPAAEVAPAAKGAMAQAPSAPRPRAMPRPEAAVIRQAQERLTQFGFAPGSIDGQLGPQTDAALRQFQAASGLPVSGRLERATRRALGIMSGEPAAARSRSEPSLTHGGSLFTPPAASAASDPAVRAVPVFE